MSRKILLVLTTLMLLTVLAVLPAGADSKINVVVNDEAVKQLDLVVRDGHMLVPVNDWVKIAGADVKARGDGWWEIRENNKILAFEPGQPGAMLNGQTISGPAAWTNGDTVYVPLRFMGATFGFEVDWDNQKDAATLTRIETRDGLTAAELLLKANQAVADFNTYYMDGKMKINIKAIADGKEMGDMPGSMDMTMSGQMQNKPMQVYIKQTVDLGSMGSGSDEALEALDGLDFDLVTETYMTEQHMYMKPPGQDWMVMEMPFSPEFWQEQQDIQSDPLKSLNQMKEWGLLLNYGNDVTMNGQNYYVLNTTMDTEKFMGAMEEMQQQLLSTMAGGADPAEAEEALAQMQKVLGESKINYFYTVYINKQTAITELVKIDMQMDLTMNAADFATKEQLAQADEDMPQQMRMIMDMQGYFNISQLGAPFVAPDVQNAQPYSMMQDMMQEIEVD